METKRTTGADKTTIPNEKGRADKKTRRPRRDSHSIRLLYALTKGVIVVSAVFSSGVRASPSKDVRRWSYEVVENASRFSLDDFVGYLERLEKRRRLADALRHVRRRRFVQLVKSKKGYTLKITEEGRSYLSRFELDQMRIEPQDPWDGIWRIVLFDIPERERAGATYFARNSATSASSSYRKAHSLSPIRVGTKSTTWCNTTALRRM